MFIISNLFRHLNYKRYGIENALLGIGIKNTLLGIPKGDKMAKNYITVSEQVIRLGSLFLMPQLPSVSNLEDVIGLVPIVAMVTSIRKDLDHIHFLMLGLDEARYSPIEMKKGYIEIREKKGHTVKIEAGLLPGIIHNSSNKRRFITDEGIEIYSRIISTTSLRLSRSEFIAMGIRIVDIRDWPIRAIESWAYRHMGIDTASLSSMVKYSESTEELINKLLMRYIASELGRERTKKKKAKSAPPPNFEQRSQELMEPREFGGRAGG